MQARRQLKLSPRDYKNNNPLRRFHRLEKLLEGLTRIAGPSEDALESLRSRSNVSIKDELNLAVSMGSFRAENVSLLVKQLLDLESDEAREMLTLIKWKTHLFRRVVTTCFSSRCTD